MYSTHFTSTVNCNSAQCKVYVHRSQHRATAHCNVYVQSAVSVLNGAHCAQCKVYVHRASCTAPGMCIVRRKGINGSKCSFSAHCQITRWCTVHSHCTLHVHKKYALYTAGGKYMFNVRCKCSQWCAVCLYRTLLVHLSLKHTTCSTKLKYICLYYESACSIPIVEWSRWWRRWAPVATDVVCFAGYISAGDANSAVGAKCRWSTLRSSASVPFTLRTKLICKKPRTHNLSNS